MTVTVPKSVTKSREEFEALCEKRYPLTLAAYMRKRTPDGHYADPYVGWAWAGFLMGREVLDDPVPPDS